MVQVKAEKETIERKLFATEQSAGQLQTQIDTILGYMTSLKQTNEKLTFELRTSQE